MNPNRHQAVDVRRRAIKDQIKGLERLIVAGRAEEHHRRRLVDTRVELRSIGAGRIGWGLGIDP